MTWRSKQRHWFLILVAAGFVFSLFYPTIWQRFNDPTQSSGSGRLFIWSVGAHALKSHFFGGVGIGAFGAIYDQFVLQVYQPVFQGWTRPSHNMLLGMLVELGPVGLVLTLGAWWATLRQVSGVAKSSAMYPFRVATEAALAGLFVAAMFTDPLGAKYYWLAFALALIVKNVTDPRPLLAGTDIGETARERAGAGIAPVRVSAHSAS